MNSYTYQLIQAVGDVPVPDQEGHEYKLADALFALLAIAMAKLPEREREHRLGEIEDEMREAVRRDSAGDNGPRERP